MPKTLSDVLEVHGIELSEDELAHYGTPGMKWGRRKGGSSGKSSGSESKPTKPKAKDLTDDELKTHINRLKLEKEYTKLSAADVSKGRKIVGELLLEVGKQQAKDYLNKEITKAIAGKAAKEVVKGVAKAATSS